MDITAAERLSEQIFDSWNDRDADRVASFFSADAVQRVNSDPPIEGREGIAAWAQTYMDAFPDIHFATERVTVSGDVVVVEWTATGTHDGPLGEIPATGRRSENRGVNINELDADGCIARTASHWDTGKLLADIGVLPVG